MRRLTRKVVRATSIIFAGLLIATSLPSRSEMAQSVAAPQREVVPPPFDQLRERATPIPNVYFEPTRVAPTGAQPFAVILCKFADVDETWQTIAEFEKLLYGQEGLDAYWREASYGRINLAGSKVVGWYTLPRAAAAYRVETGSDVDLLRLAMDCTAAADADITFPDYAGIGMAFNRDVRANARGGKACLDLDGRSRCYGAFWLWPANSHNRALVAHEMGHAFGLSHSTTMDEAELGDAWDVMSEDGQWWPNPYLDPAPQHMIAHDKDLLGCIGAERKFIAAARTQTIMLERLAQPGPDGYLMAQIPIGGSATHFYTVEARRRVGFDRSLPADGVVIHEVDTTRSLPAVLVNRGVEPDLRATRRAWEAGQRFLAAEHGIAISVDAETETGSIVTISTQPQPWPFAPSAHEVVPAGEVRFRLACCPRQP